LLSKNNSTDALETGFLDEDPLNTTSVIESLRRFLAELSPKTQRTASITFDLPQPLGPTMQDILEGKVTVVGSTKDLKPESLIEFSLIFLIPLGGKNPMLYEKALMKQN
jgi:hypothetical protein